MITSAIRKPDNSVTVNNPDGSFQLMTLQEFKKDKLKEVVLQDPDNPNKPYTRLQTKHPQDRAYDVDLQTFLLDNFV